MSLYTVTFDSSDEEEARESSSSVEDELVVVTKRREAIVPKPPPTRGHRRRQQSRTPDPVSPLSKQGEGRCEKGVSEGEDVVMRKQVVNLDAEFVGDAEAAVDLHRQLKRAGGVAAQAGLIPYELVRRKKLLGSRKVEFMLSREDAAGPMLYCSFQHAGPQEVHIFKHKEACSRRAWEALLLVGGNESEFSLRLGGRFGVELMNIKFERGSVRGSRRMSVHMLCPPDGVERELVSKAPVMNGQDWELDLNGRVGKISKMNCILLDSHGREIFSVVKTRSDAVTVEASAALNRIYVFALAVSTCICKL